ncbi:glycosyl transferase family 2 [Alicyclobacillus hesperidum subsp. aegles]|uniref:glycosyltransferase family 2 protein n=1 Tax=Alicyclobacillus hesperidum TaxID=89784 RepID=UPI0007192786|nr:glycosyltransferase family 2 protein [Alicyclobacillus hesperidum]KRW92952.1 glycosyl transferase family 2 [Alicyclobacillus tengchongensis]GLG01369.1 glycosyl transferase family 2 [Alicyclobacillus hesperidum subsp. aegles]
MTLMYALFNTFYGALKLITGIVAVYQLVLSLYGLWHRKQAISHAPKKRFAVIIPAHNEERVVGPLIDSIKQQTYPDHLFDIHLIADNCTDHTADVARMHGATVHLRENASDQGKGYAIEWMLNRLKKMKAEYDAIVMFDADNLVDPEFLAMMNDHLCRGDRVIQGYLDTKNPFDTWISVSLALSYWFDNRLWQYARRKLGLSCTLGGTGLCIDYTLLQEMGWKATGLTEDLEFGIRCVRRGIIPVWAHDAKVYDEKPTGFHASFRQRLRWQQGHFQCAKEHMIPMFIQGIRERNLAKIDMAVYLFQPMRSMLLFVGAMLMFALQYAAPEQTGTVSAAATFATDLWVAVNLLLFLEIPLALILERVNWRAYFGLALLPFFLWTWGPVTLQAYFTRSNRKWYHTVHKRAIRLDQLRER